MTFPSPRRLHVFIGFAPGSASVSLAVGCVPRLTSSRAPFQESMARRNVFGGTPNTDDRDGRAPKFSHHQRKRGLDRRPGPVHRAGENSWSD